MPALLGINRRNRGLTGDMFIDAHAIAPDFRGYNCLCVGVPGLHKYYIENGSTLTFSLSADNLPDARGNVGGFVQVTWLCSRMEMSESHRFTVSAIASDGVSSVRMSLVEVPGQSLRVTFLEGDVWATWEYVRGTGSDFGTGGRLRLVAEGCVRTQKMLARMARGHLRECISGDEFVRGRAEFIAAGCLVDFSELVFKAVANMDRSYVACLLC